MGGAEPRSRYLAGAKVVEEGRGNGSEEFFTVKLRYQEPSEYVDVNETTALRARAIRYGYQESTETAATFTFDE